MIKKIALAAALSAGAAFATWDYYPVLEGGKGSAKGGLYYDWDHDWSQAGLKVGARYSIIPNLEISLQSWGVQFWGEWDCKGCVNGGGGLRDLTVGGRYEIAPMITAFMDLNLPSGNDEVEWNQYSKTTPPSSEEIAIYLGGQFSMDIKEAPGLKFGSEAGLDWGFEHDNYERGLELHLGGEMGYTVPNTEITPFIGLQIKYRITESTTEAQKSHIEKIDGKDVEVFEGETYEVGLDDDGDKQINLWLGADCMIIPNQLNLRLQLIVRSGRIGGEASGLYTGAEYYF